jgi:DNA-directed RNA polymerase subunit omega|tara:strand:- start:126 stop:590 length:465 start_codon:yes stop_codon:yes gene_type:complete
MARITVEDCLSKVDNQYDLVLLAKERASQLNAGDKPLVPENNDKNTVVSLREIGEGQISIKTIEDAVINKLRKIQIQPTELEDLEIEEEDNFDKIYKGEVSKSGTAILPSKRARRMPEKIIARHKAENNEIKKDIKQSDEKAKDVSLPAKENIE